MREHKNILIFFLSSVCLLLTLWDGSEGRRTHIGATREGTLRGHSPPLASKAEF